MWPQVSWIGVTGPFSGGAKRLARESRNDEIHNSAPRFSVEGLNVRPYRRVVKIPIRHARLKDADAISFPLNVTDNPCGMGGGSLDAQFKPTNPGT